MTELVVTIVILGLLAAIGSVSYSAFLSDSRSEIAAIEDAQDDRIVGAHDLLNGGASLPVEPLSLSYSSGAFSLASTSETIAPTVSGGTASSFSYTGTLPDGVSFNTETGVFTGPSAWNIDGSTVSVGPWHTCALTTAGAALCWGSNEAGQLGTGDADSRATPTQVVGLTSGVTSIAVGDYYTCAVHNGAVKCWGSNGFGQLGIDNMLAGSWTPMLVGNPWTEDYLSSGATQVSAGKNHTCAVVSGAAYCWGLDNLGQLGTGTDYAATGDNPMSWYPAQVSGFTSGVTAISVAEGSGYAAAHTCATHNGAVKCWGSNGTGQLGLGDTEPPMQANTPAQVLGLTSGATAVAVGYNQFNGGYSCAVVSGAVKCWGAGNRGSIGGGVDGENYEVSSSTPISVRDESNNPTLTSGVTAISAGWGSTCAVAGGAVYCWGENQNGQVDPAPEANGWSGFVLPLSTLNSGATAVSVNRFGACAVVSGEMKCWGSTNGSPSAPTSVSGFGNPGFPSIVTVTVTDSSARTATFEVTITKS